MEPKKKRFTKRTLRVMAWAAGAMAFAAPWAAFQLVPTSTTSAQGASTQVVVVPAGSKVTVLSSPTSATGVKVVRSKAATSATTKTVKGSPVTTTGASAPPP